MHANNTAACVPLLRRQGLVVLAGGPWRARLTPHCIRYGLSLKAVKLALDGKHQLLEVISIDDRAGLTASVWGLEFGQAV